MPRMCDNLQQEVDKLIKKAKVDGCWFYCTATKQWFTPEEFSELAQVTIIEYGDKNPDLFINYNLSDPKEGIRKRLAYVKKASYELQEFTEKVMSYYNFIGKNLK